VFLTHPDTPHRGLIAVSLLYEPSDEAQQRRFGQVRHNNGAIDKDANGQPDDCQYAHGDFDLSGDIGGGDLGFLLAVWGTNSIIGDLDGDHIIGGGDLGTLLSRWGPVQ
jgi:hypothetical protein